MPGPLDSEGNDQLPFLEKYFDMSARQIVALRGKFDTYSLAEAVAMNIDWLPWWYQNQVERTVLTVFECVTSIMHEGYWGTFINPNERYVPRMVEAFRAVGCPKSAEISVKAIRIMQFPRRYSRKTMNTMAEDLPEDLQYKLHRLDQEFLATGEEIGARLLDYVAAHQAKIRIPVRPRWLTHLDWRR